MITAVELRRQVEEIQTVVLERLQTEAVHINTLYAELCVRYDSRAVRSGLWDLISQRQAVLHRGNLLAIKYE